jgi:hypothetical protein
MAVEKKSKPLVDPSAVRLLQTIGLDDFEYYSAGKEKAVKESLQKWPLLRAVCDSITAAAARRSRAAIRSLSSTPVVLDEPDSGQRGPVPLASGGHGVASAVATPEPRPGAPKRSESAPLSKGEHP